MPPTERALLKFMRCNNVINDGYLQREDIARFLPPEEYTQPQNKQTIFTHEKSERLRAERQCTSAIREHIKYVTRCILLVVHVYAIWGLSTSKNLHVQREIPGDDNRRHYFVQRGECTASDIYVVCTLTKPGVKNNVSNDR